MTCQHIDTLPAGVTAEADVCQDCVAEGNRHWVHLRLCLSCGHVGCCDSSPLKHATAHYKAADHPVIQSHEPGEDWRWCYVDNRIV